MQWWNCTPVRQMMPRSGFQLRLHTHTRLKFWLVQLLPSRSHTSPLTIECLYIDDSPDSHFHQDTQSHHSYSHALYSRITRIPQCPMHEAHLRVHSEVEDAEEEVAEEDAEEVP